MATIIDALAVELSLDPEKFKKGLADAVEDLKKFKEAGKKHGDEVEKQTKDMAEGFGSVTKKIGELAVAYLGFNAIKSFIQDVVASNVALNNTAAALGLSTDRLSSFQTMARLSGASAEGMTATLRNVQRELVNISTFHNPSQTFLIGASMLGLPQAAFLGTNGQPADMQSFLLATQRAAQQQLKGGAAPGAVSMELQRLGIQDEGMIAAIMQRSPEELKKFLEEAKKLAPSAVDINAAKELNTEFNRLGVMLSKLGYDLLPKINDVLGPFVKRLESILDYFNGTTPKEDWRNAPPTPPTQWQGVPGGGPSDWWGGVKKWWHGTSASSLNPISPANAAPVENIPGAGSGAIFGGGGGQSAYLNNQRKPFRKEMEDNPETRDLVAAMLKGEDPQNRTAAVESLFNRTAMVNENRANRGLPPLSIRDMILGHPSIDHGKSFYNPVRTGSIYRDEAELKRNPNLAKQIYGYVDEALGGSHKIGGYTDQGSPGDPNYASGGGITFPNHERYGDWRYPGSVAWRKRQEQSIGGGQSPWNVKSSGIPWLDHPPALLHNQTSNTTNSSTAETHIGYITVNTQATDAHGIAKEIGPLLKNRSSMMMTNTGPQ